MIVERTELLPDILQFIRGYSTIVLWVMIGIFVVKYAVYGYRTMQDVKYARMDDPKDEKYGYFKLGVYPLCDLLRFAVLLGLLSAFIGGLLTAHVVINVFVDYFIYVAILLAVLFVDFFCWASETIRANLISTGILLAVILLFSKDLFMQGLKLL
jgi:ascorbate-specific PTS system EIIC-type component UlaA